MAGIQDLSAAAARAKQLATIAKIIAGLRAAGASQNTGGGNSGGGGSGGGGGGGAPVSTLAGLPKSPLLDKLIKDGLIKEGMPPAQALAILQFGKLREGVPIDMAALMKLVEGDYDRTTGDIETAGADWMKEMMGTAYDPNDPNAALFANDPTFSSYAGGLTQMGETADQNLATDLAWFRKEQEAQDTYYNDMMTAIATGALPIGAAATGGGGGGGGGGGRGYGGGGGGGGGGDAGDLKTTFKTTDSLTESATDNVMEINPNYRTDILNYASQFGPDVADQMEEIMNLTPSGRGQDVNALLEERQIALDAQIAARDDLDIENNMWAVNAPAQFRQLLDDYQAKTGLSLGDDPNAPGSQAFHYAERTGDDPRTLDEEEGADNVYSYGPADMLQLPEAQQQEMEELRQLLEPALLGATNNNVFDPANISKAANAVGYLQSLAKNRLAGNTAGGIAEAVEDQGTTTADELVTDPDTGISSPATPATNPFAQIIAQVAGQIGQSAGARGAVVPGQPPSPSSTQYTDPNIIQPPGSEVQNTPENNLAFNEATGTWPWTPATDDPNAGTYPFPDISQAISQAANQAGPPPVTQQHQSSNPNMPNQPRIDELLTILGQTASIPDWVNPGINRNRNQPTAVTSNPFANAVPGIQDWVNPGINRNRDDPAGPVTQQHYGSNPNMPNQPRRDELLALLGQTATPNPNMPGTEVPNTPEANLAFNEETGEWPWTPTSDDPNAPQTTSAEQGFALPNQAIMQGLARAGLLNRPQEGTPEDPTSDLVKAITQQATQPTELPDFSGLDPQAILKAQNDAMIPELEEMGYNGEEAENFRYNWNGVNVSPELMREHYLQDALINDVEPSWGNPNPEESGRLVPMVERLMQARSLAALREQTAVGYDAESRAAYGEPGEFYHPNEGLTDDEYERAKEFVGLIPTFQDYTNTGGSLGNGLSYNPAAGPSLINSKFSSIVKDIASRATDQKIYTDPNEFDENGLYPLDEPMPFDDYALTPPEEDLEDLSYDANTKLTGSGGNRPQVANLKGNRAAATARLLAQSAAQMKLPPTVQKPTPRAVGGGRRGTGAAGGGARAAQGASALARLAKVLRNFK